jgi:hypothetical protein
MENVWFLFLIFLFIFTIFSYWVCFSLFCTILYDAPFVPLKKSDVKRLKSLSLFRSKATVYDLGSGDGSTLIYLVREFGVRGIGIERSRFLSLWSRWRIRRAGFSSKITIQRKNFFRQNLSDADVVVCYLFPEAMRKLAGKFERELRLGSFVVSFSFQIPEWKPVKVEKRLDGKNPMYIYQKS